MERWRVVVFLDEKVLNQLSVGLPRGVRSVLGAGGCGLVLRVQPDLFSHEIAMKIAWKGNEEQIQKERKVLEHLRGVGGVVKLLEPGEEPAPYFAYEMVAGRTLEEYFKRGMVTVESACLLYTSDAADDM
jgi:predicted Ser/Thr protein kinase